MMNEEKTKIALVEKQKECPEVLKHGHHQYKSKFDGADPRTGKPTYVYVCKCGRIV